MEGERWSVLPSVSLSWLKHTYHQRPYCEQSDGETWLDRVILGTRIEMKRCRGKGSKGEKVKKCGDARVV